MTEHTPQSGNLFTDIPAHSRDEQFIELLRAPGVRIERIVSTGQATPKSEWLDQAWTEWVVLLSGAARIHLDSEPAMRDLKPGDWIEIPPHARHRVEWTAPNVPTVWLAIHIGVDAK